MSETPAGRAAAGRALIGPVRLAWAESSEPRATGRRLLAELVAELLPARAPAAVFSSQCSWCGGDDHGRPVAQGAPVSVSVGYAGSLVVVAAAHDRDAAALGVDIEPERPGSDEPMVELAALFAPAPPPDLRGWTMIEAALKADGRGLRVAPGEVRFGMPQTGAERVVAASVLGAAAVLASVPGAADRIEVAPAPGPAGFVVSVAVVGAR